MLFQQGVKLPLSDTPLLFQKAPGSWVKCPLPQMLHRLSFRSTEYGSLSDSKSLLSRSTGESEESMNTCSSVRGPSYMGTMEEKEQGWKGARLIWNITNLQQMQSEKLGKRHVKYHQFPPLILLTSVYLKWFTNYSLAFWAFLSPLRLHPTLSLSTIPLPISWFLVKMTYSPLLPFFPLYVGQSRDYSL